MEPYYSDERTTLYHGDCLEVLPGLGQFDLVFTSPPYNLGGEPWPHIGHWKHGGKSGTGGSKKWRGGADSNGVNYQEHADNLPWAEYVEWQRSCLLMAWERLSDAGAIFYNHKPRVVGERLWLPTELNPDLPLRQIVTWARPGGMNFSKVAFVPTCEWIMVFAKPAWRLKSRAVSGLGDVWRVNTARGNTHPAPFPVELPGKAIEASAPLSVLDPFAGSGTTLVAAKSSGVCSVGIEKSEQYCEMAAKRLVAC